MLKASLCNFLPELQLPYNTLRCDFLNIHGEQVHRLASLPRLFLRSGYPCFLYEYLDLQFQH